MFPDNFENFPDTDYRLKNKQEPLKAIQFPDFAEIIFCFLYVTTTLQGSFPQGELIPYSVSHRLLHVGISKLISLFQNSSSTQTCVPHVCRVYLAW